MIKSVFKDPVIYFLLAVNIGLAYAFFNQYISAETILFTYFFQSLTLGLSYFLQIILARKYTVANLKINGKQVDNTVKTKGCMGIFFLFHYGFFHLVYFLFLIVIFDFNVDYEYLMYGITAFALGELTAVVRHSMLFEGEVRNIGTMMFTPYLRIIPMHLFIIAGGFIGYQHRTIFLIFILLKIVSDALMHIVVNKTYMAKQLPTQTPVTTI